MIIRLRAIEEGDLPQLRDWRNDDRLRHGFREYRLLNMVNQHDWFDHISRSNKVEMFGIEVDGLLVGVCGLCNINWVSRVAEPSRYLAPAYESLMPEVIKLLRKKAFEEFNLRRLWTEVYSFRTERIALLEQQGYILEGRLRKHVFKQGQYHDSLIYGLLKEEINNG